MVSKELVILGRLAKELNGKFSEPIESRIAFQKKIYLLQLCGIDIGYVFGWDLYGPYSKTLAQNAGLYQEYKDEIDAAAEELKLTKWAEGVIERTRQLMTPPEGVDIKQPTWLELLSSLHYLAEYRFGTVFLQGQGERLRSVKELLLQKKPHLRKYESLIDQAWESLWSCLSEATSIAG